MKVKSILNIMLTFIFSILLIVSVVFMTMMTINLTLYACGYDFRIDVLLSLMIDIIFFVLFSRCIF